MKPVDPKQLRARSALLAHVLATFNKVYMNRFPSVQSLKAACLGVSSIILLSACASFSGVQSAQGTAQSAISQGNVNVFLKDGVAIVTGKVPDASAEQAVARALLKREDVDSVDMQLFREM